MQAFRARLEQAVRTVRRRDQEARIVARTGLLQHGQGAGGSHPNHFRRGNGERALITFKGPKRGLYRTEYEYPMPIEQGRQALLLLPPSRIIHKIRYDIPHGGLVWSVDRFQDANAGWFLPRSRSPIRISGSSCRLGSPRKSRITRDMAIPAWRAAQFPLPHAPPDASRQL